MSKDTTSKQVEITSVTNYLSGRGGLRRFDGIGRFVVIVEVGGLWLVPSAAHRPGLQRQQERDWSKVRVERDVNAAADDGNAL